MSRLLRPPRGFTLIELLVVMVISSIIMTAVVAVFGNQTKATALQEDYVALEQNLRAAMDFVVRDSRLAGTYTKEIFPPFTIGEISVDVDGDGSLNTINTEGGAGPDAIRIRYANAQGVEIKKFPGNANHFWLCNPSGLRVAQELELSRYLENPSTHLNGDDLTVEKRIIESIAVDTPNCAGISCPNTCEKVVVNRLLEVSSEKYQNGMIWPSLEVITYFIPPGGAVDYPALMRVRNDELPAIVAFGITDLQIVYIRADGSEITAIATADPVERKNILMSIRRVRITVTGETRNAHAIGGAPSKPTRTMTTEVQVRNLAL